MWRAHEKEMSEFSDQMSGPARETLPKPDKCISHSQNHQNPPLGWGLAFSS